MLEFCKSEIGFGQETYEKMIEKLSCENPEEIDNYPHETPYIRKMEVKE